ncbi:hypothetical protein BRE01_67150 [Brevibacillus reuszeri]|uniref:Uncharacterized protein n=1 Tax=Brevibacillus reuszeri TaxID=54915 RepID=A0A0K9YZS4_9BACL|nr:hypothetical protein [Brevibacillus reuszeri]KNB74233.1 hypothetical protein ADS79_03480 [Brevibacillus reuszeri]MED1859630.1 hypothetical protein [Brevibacillus reuszeri]GED73013.1 hypothetical protein BRE01_67150 [Brevibacillus reuszeri]
MKTLLISVFTIVRIAIVLLGTFFLTGVLFFQFFYNEQNENELVYIHLAVAFLINFIWYRWKERKSKGM